MKDREIIRLKVFVDDLSQWTYETNDDMKRKDNELSQVNFVLRSRQTEVENTKK